MARVKVPEERVYVEAELGPVIAALRTDDALLGDFLTFARKKGGNLGLVMGRLQKSWRPSRELPQSAFYTLILYQFGLARGLIPLPKRRGR